jgi:hypothetical protein
MYDTELINYLKANPRILAVYFAADGKWYLLPKPSRKMVTRDEILLPQSDDKETTIKKPSKKDK